MLAEHSNIAEPKIPSHFMKSQNEDDKKEEECRNKNGEQERRDVLWSSIVDFEYTHKYTNFACHRSPFRKLFVCYNEFAGRLTKTSLIFLSSILFLSHSLTFSRARFFSLNHSYQYWANVKKQQQCNLESVLLLLLHINHER